MNSYDDIPRHKKKANHKPPKKANHKHEFVSCVLEFDSPHFDKQHGQVMVKDARINGYCPVCGKIGQPCDWERWWNNEVRYDGFCHVYSVSPSEDAKRELNPETRMLPTFGVDDWLFPKYVSLVSEEEENGVVR